MSKSYEVDYAFGQIGSIFTDTTDPIFPPKEKVIVAFTCLEDTTFATTGGLRSEFTGSDTGGLVRYICGDDTATLVAHSSANARQTSSTSGSSTTLTLSGLNTDIKVGMIIESTDTDIPGSINTVGFPLYNQNPTTVAAYDGATTVTMSAAHNVSSQTVYFFSEGVDNAQGFGGDTVDVSNTFPKGVTIYGRWTRMDLASGSGIAYLGI